MLQQIVPFGYGQSQKLFDFKASKQTSMNYNRDLCPLTVVGNEGPSYYIHPAMKYKTSNIKQDPDPRDELDFNPLHWEQLFKLKTSPIQCTILPIKHTNTDHNQFLYDQNTNFLQYIINPSSRHQIINKHKGITTKIKSLPKLHRNKDIKLSLKSLKSHKYNIIAIYLHFAFNTKKLKLFIPPHHNKNDNHINADQITLAGFISPPQSDDIYNYKQIKWMIAIDRDTWNKGNYQKQPFFQLKYQCLALQQYFLHHLLTQKMCHHLAKLTAENHLKFTQFTFYVCYIYPPSELQQRVSKIHRLII